MDKQPSTSRGGKRWSRFRGRGRNSRPFFKKRPQGESPASDSSEPSPNVRSTSTTSESQLSLTNFSSCPYPGWRLYFPSEEYSENSVTLQKVKYFEKYLEQNGSLFPKTSIENTRSFSIDLKTLLENVEFVNLWPDFKNDLTNLPEHTLGCLGLAMHQAILFKNNVNKSSDGIKLDSLPYLAARVRNFEPILPLGELKNLHYGKLVSVVGTIIRLGCPKLILSSMAYECRGCQTLLCLRQPEGILTEPIKCSASGCKSTVFTPLRCSPYTISNSLQEIRLQGVTREQGRVPSFVDCQLLGDLTEKWCPGDVVTVTGIVKINAEEPKKGAAHIVPIYLKAVSITNNKSQTGSGPVDEPFNLRDYYAIKEIHSEPKLFRLLVQSLNPAIYGHEVVKAGLLLGLFGGCEREHSRSDPHVLVVGDPGLGKSQMLQACANIAPKGVYVCGNTSSTAGLTVTVKREGGDYALEAGALVMADEGCCCIDEFDKMTNQHYALLDAMEDQKVSIAKHGVVCSMPARCCVLAAANPVGGHYNKAKTVSENLKLGPALLSRFDLVFILLDQPDEYLDGMLSDHIMLIHSSVKDTSRPSIFDRSHSSSQYKSPLQQKLKLLPGEELDFIPPQLIRKYIAYAKKYVHPRVSDGAAEILQKFYLELRRHQQGGDSTPVTTRQLESLIRLTEARAKLELRELATAEDANEIVEIFKTSMIDTWSTEVGNLDVSRSMHGAGMSSRNVAKKFVSILQRRAEGSGRCVFSIAEMKELAKNASLAIGDFSNFLSSLNLQGILLKKGPNMYQLLSAD